MFQRYIGDRAFTASIELSPTMIPGYLYKPQHIRVKDTYTSPTHPCQTDMTLLLVPDLLVNNCLTESEGENLIKKVKGNGIGTLIKMLS